MSGRFSARALTVGDLVALGPHWPAALAALARVEGLATPDALACELPQLLQALTPVLCRVSGLAADDIAALALPEALELVTALVEAQGRPFARN